MGVKQANSDIMFDKCTEDSIVITGVSGKLPKCDNVHVFRDRLFNKEVMLSDEESRWHHVHPEIPKTSGKIPEVKDFDLGFFGFGSHFADKEDPMLRMLLETTFEAILDAGYNPAELVGTNTGVFVAICFSENDQGDLTATIPSYLNYIFRLNGPSMNIDTACSSSLTATDEAYKALRLGTCDRAIVAASNLLLLPNVSLQFARLGVLSKNGQCRPFDDDGQGYIRSEGIVSLLLEKQKYARRVYAEIVHTKTNSDGYKSQGITFPSTERQTELLTEFYQECKIDPRSISFVEAHGTGTPVGDPEELLTLDNVFCKDRESPLHIGSLKSNIGHNEPVSGISSIVKVIIGMEAGIIPANVNYEKPRKGCDSLEQGRIVVITENMPFSKSNGLVAVNSFGFGGSNAHVLLRWNQKEKINGSLPTDNIPRLVCISGRTEKMINTIIGDLKSRKIDVDHIKLYHSIYSKKINQYNHRGYVILDKTKDAIVEMDATPNDVYQKKKLCCVFCGYDENWMEYSKQLMCFQVFANNMDLLRAKLNRDALIDVSTIPDSYQQKMIENIVGTMLLQISLVELLKSINIKPDIFLGIGSGELVAAYLDGCLTLKEIMAIGLYFCTKAPKNIPAQKMVMTFKTWRPNLAKKSNRIEDAVEYFKTSFSTPVPLETLKTKMLKEAKLAVFGQTDDAIGFFCKNTEAFLMALGRLFLNDFDMDLAKLYPDVSYPVSRGTPMISPLVSWTHDRQCWIISLKGYGNSLCDIFTVTIGKESLNEMSYIEGHVIDGRTLFPATGYLALVWKFHSRMRSLLIEETKVIFRDIQFVRAGTINKQGTLELQLAINVQTGRFEITEKDSLLVKGFIFPATDDDEAIDVPVLELDESKGILKEKDIYKEFRLRGYNYQGMFRALKECNMEGTRGTIVWEENWVTFMDTMLQIKLIQEDTKNLYVPTSINSIFIDAKTHISRCVQYDNKVPVMANKDFSLITGGGIQIQGLGVNSIPRRKPAEPVLEYSKFIPYEAALEAAEAIRCFVQLILENTRTIKFKSVEVVPETEIELLTPIVQEVLGDLPLIRPDIAVLTPNKVELSNARIENGDLKAEKDCLLVIVNGGFQNQELMEKAVHAIQQSGGFILTREDVNFTPSAPKLNIVSVMKTPKETLFLLNSTKDVEEKPCLVLTHSLDDFKWIETLQELLKTNKKVIVYAQNIDSNGLLGLYNCLKHEFYDMITCVFLMGQCPKFNPNDAFYKKQLSKSLAVNICKDGTWGSYRHLLLPQCEMVESEHCYVNVTTRGDLSSLRWIENSLTKDTKLDPEIDLIDVYYAAINFRDIMTASGKLPPDVITRDRIRQECVQGMEFSGRDSRGNRIMSIGISGGMGTITTGNSYTSWPIPDHWTLEDAATVPVVYATVIFAFIQRANVKRGQTVLIHAGSGGVGQAAIHMASYYGLTIFTTVGTPEKKEFIMQHCPQIKEEHIGDSRSISFEQMILNKTNGRGVDIILNSLAEEKLQASVRCLAPGGVFLEIGKFDLAKDNPLPIGLLDKQASFHGIMLDEIVMANSAVSFQIAKDLQKAISDGAVKPLVRKTFEIDELETAFRYMASGKHIGKVVIKIRDEEDTKTPVKVPRTLFKGIPRFYCNPDATYVILGGLGGFGLELADWLVVRGAKKLVLTSRTGIKTGYQTLKLKVFKSYGANVVIRNDDITSKEGCEELLKACEDLGPVDAIFNLAVVLQDGLFENQKGEAFGITLAPKAIATKYLDAVSRVVCPGLRYFVVFSSVSCGRGNAGQTNYGMANSVMERVCELRKKDGYPALAIQWGAIGEVGLVAEMQEKSVEMEIGGTLQQKISNCLQVLDKFLRQKETIVASMVVAEKKTSSGGSNIIDDVLHILGVTNIKSISLHATFPELGMDSIMGVELKQTLERDYDIFLAPQDMRTLTLAKLKDMVDEKQNPDAAKERQKEEERLQEQIELLLKHIGDELTAHIPRIVMDTLVSPEDKNVPHVFALAGIEGQAAIFNSLAKKLQFRMTCLQLCPDNHLETIEDIALSVLDEFKSTEGDNFVILAYSVGAIIATELTHLLEQRGKRGKLIYIDGAPDYLQETLQNIMPYTDENLFQTMILCGLMTKYIPYKSMLQHQVNILKCEGFAKKMEHCATLIETRPDNHSEEFIMNCLHAAYARTKAVRSYKPQMMLESTVLLAKASETSVAGVSDDFGLAKLFTSHVLVESFDGNHVTILENDALAHTINNFVLNN